MKDKISVCIPVYNGEKTIVEAIKSVLSQTFKDFELVIVDNASTDKTVEQIRSIKDKRIKLYQNKSNLGCGGNLTVCKEKAKGEIVFYVCADNIIDIHTLEKVYNAFSASPDVGIVTRPYFFYEKDIEKPVRLTRQFKKEEIVTINSPFEKIGDVIALADQISGIGLRKKYMEPKFSPHPFVEMASMVLPMLKKYKAVILKDNTVAARITFSGAKSSQVYINSPMMAWYNLIFKTFSEEKYKDLVRYLVDNFVANNYIGLVQIKNYGTMRQLLREIYYLLKLRWKNIFSLKFWFFSLGTIMVPRFLLLPMVPLYKDKINSQLIEKIKFEYSI